MESTNFEFIRSRWPAIAEDAASAERDVHENPRGAVRHLRSICEEVLRSVFEKPDQTLKPILNAHRPDLPGGMDGLLDELKEAADDAVHAKPGRRSDRINREKVMRHLRTTYDLLVWAAEKLGDTPPPGEFVEPPPGGLEFDEAMKLAGRRRQKFPDWIQATSEGGYESAADDRYIGRSAIIGDIESRLLEGRRRILIAGEPGRGKTRLLKELFTRKVFERIAEPGNTFSYFFVSTSRRDPRAWVQHFYASILERFDLGETEDSIRLADSEKLQDLLCARLTEICGHAEAPRLVFVIDAIDEANDAEQAVLNFVAKRLPALPEQVTFVATLRPGHLPHGESADIDLEDVERLNEHRSDGRSYVKDRLAGRHLPQNLIEEIAKVGDGNFRALYHICQQIPDIGSHEDIRQYLDRLRSSPDVLTGVYEDWWKRLERQVGPDDLDKLVRMAVLIAAAQAPISRNIMQGVLNPRRHDWRAFEKYLTEYLKITEREAPDTTDEKSGQKNVTVFRFYHATFTAFLRAEFQDEIEAAHGQLADFCCDWRPRSRQWHSLDYSLRFAVRHCIQTERWPELTDRLTDLAFIQARFQAGHASELLIDFDEALRSHPESRERIQRRTEVSGRWVREIVAYSRACSEIRKRHTAGELADPVTEIQKLVLPKAPDTRDVEHLMREADYQSRSESCVSTVSSDSDRILEWRGFVNRWFHYLDDFPHLTASIARKHGTIGVALAGRESSDGGPDYLRRTGSWEPAARNTLLIREIVDRLPDAGFCSGGMTRDAAVVFGARDPDTSVWETESGKRHTFDNMLCISADGACGVFDTWAYSDDPRSIYVVAFETDRVVAERDGVRPLVYWEDSNLHWTLTMQMTPDASTLVFIDGHDSDDPLTSFCVWSLWNDEVFRFVIDDLSPWRVYLAPSGTVAAVLSVQDGSALWRFFDLVDRTVISDIPGSDVVEFLNEQWYAGELRLAQKLQKPLGSIDGRFTVRQDPDDSSGQVPGTERLNRVEILVDGKPVRSFGAKRPFRSILGLSAEGRLAFADTPAGFAVLDLAEGIWNEPLTDEDDIREPIEPDGSELQNDADPLKPATEQEAVLLEMGIAAYHRSESVYELDKLLDSDEPDESVKLTGKDVRQPKSSVGLQRQFDNQTLYEFPHECWTPKSTPKSTPDGTRWSTGESDCGVIDIVTGKTSTLPDSGKPVAWTHDGRVLITIGPDADIRFWNSLASAWIDGRAISKLVISGDSVSLSPDGRRVAWGGGFSVPTVLTINTGAVTRHCDLKWVWANDPRFSADGLHIVTTYQYLDLAVGGQFLWDVQTGECLDLICYYGDTEEVRVSAPEPVIPWVTGVRIFRPESTPALEDLHEPLYPNGRIPGRFDEEITFRCQHCGRRSPLPADTQDCIRSIHRTARLSDEDSPVLKLPDAAWQDPGLSLECPNCHQPHKSTPFVVDRQRELSDRPQ